MVKKLEEVDESKKVVKKLEEVDESKTVEESKKLEDDDIWNSTVENVDWAECECNDDDEPTFSDEEVDDSWE